MLSNGYHDFLTRKRPKIKNWKDLHEQFPKGQTTKTAAMFADAIGVHIETHGNEPFITIGCNKFGHSESIACFRQIPGQLWEYEYEGTAC